MTEILVIACDYQLPDGRCAARTVPVLAEGWERRGQLDYCPGHRITPITREPIPIRRTT